MIFLQQTILWGLPLLLLPLIIHLLNRLRFRSVGWGAMQFLLAATRQSTRRARVRQWLLLAMRMAAVLCLVLALGRPLAGGWLGHFLGGPPETVVLLVDRSASMAALEGPPPATRIELARSTFVEAARQSGASRFIVIDNVTLTPFDAAGEAALDALPLGQATDTAADLPAMLEATAAFLHEQRTGPTEIWIASDLQRSNWRPDEGRWRELAAALESLPQRVRLRVLAMNGAPPANLAVQVDRALTFQREESRRLSLWITVQGIPPGTGTVPLRLNLDGNELSLPVTVDGSRLRVQHQLDLGAKTSGGWGMVGLPADANDRDNRAWFVYGEAVPLTAVVAAESAASRGYLGLAAAPLGKTSPAVIRVEAGVASGIDLAQAALLVWQGTLPARPGRERILQFVEEGGVFLAFPGDGEAGEPMAGLGWGPLEAAGESGGFGVTSWEEADGPLARTLAGESLPLAGVTMVRRRAVEGDGEVLASDREGVAWLRRARLGRGQVLLCGTSPDPAWSSLAEGPVLVPMIQRLLVEGGGRLAGTESAWVGRERAAEGGSWEPIGAAGGGSPAETAGAYRHDGRLVSLNRPPAEDEPAVLTLEEAVSLFGELPVEAFRHTGATNTALPSELWRWLVIAMLAALAVEALLAQPTRSARPAPAARVPA